LQIRAMISTIWRDSCSAVLMCMPTSTRQVLGERTLVYREYSFYGRPSEAEDPPELGSDQRTGKFPSWPKWQTVVDLITNRGCFGLFKKPVAVDPLPVGTFY